jgi:hypothetical protein
MVTMVRSQTGCRKLLATVLLLVACSSSSLGVGPKKDAGPPTDVSGIETRDGALANKDAAPEVIIPAIPVGRDAATDLGPLCQEITSLSYDAGVSRVPLDWQSAQSPSAWCGMYQSTPRTSLCLLQTSDGYNEAVIAAFEGGEMAMVAQAFYVYDPQTGKLVAQLFAVTPTQPLVCEFRTPDGPANPGVYPGACLAGIPLQPVCAPVRDAGSVD